MVRLPAGGCPRKRFWRAALCGLLLSVLVPAITRAQGPVASPHSATHVLTLDSAIVWALERNPELAAIRQRHGIAAAAVLIAQTYPFNPVWEAEIRAANGPESAGVTNHVSNIHKLLLELEVRGQGGYRRQGARAALSRTDWEIAYQELLTTGHVITAFNSVLYRKLKLQLQEETVGFNEELVKQVSVMQSVGKVTAADLILASTELDDVRLQVGLGRAALTAAISDLRRQLGEVDGEFDVTGSLEPGKEVYDAETLTKVALNRRPDLLARQAALAEADAAVGLTIANRYGNPTAGPDYEYDPTRINLIGIQFSLPIPVLNTHKGDILQRQRERDRAGLELRQNEITVRQDVRAAVLRYNASMAQVNLYRNELLPHFLDAQKKIEALFIPAAATDFFRVVDIRRKVLRARDGYLDALLEVNQARSDLVLAVGDLALASGP